MKISTSVYTATILAGLLLTSSVMAADTMYDYTATNATTNTPTVSSNTTTTTSLQDQRIARAKDRANLEIDRRTTALTRQMDRVNAMTRVSATVKSNLASTTQTQLSDLAALKTKIAGDTDLTTLRTDVGSITKSYRIFALVMPQTAITAAVDRIHTIADTMTSIVGKVTTRLSDAQSAGKDVSSLQSKVSDATTHIADAKTQADAAVSEIASLQPDNGDQAAMTSNHNALVDARSKIRAAQQDLKTARQDLGSVVSGLKALAPSTSAAGTAQVTN